MGGSLAAYPEELRQSLGRSEELPVSVSPVLGVRVSSDVSTAEEQRAREAPPPVFSNSDSDFVLVSLVISS